MAAPGLLAIGLELGSVEVMVLLVLSPSARLFLV